MHKKLNFKTAFNSFKLYKYSGRVSFDCVEHFLIFWSITQMFSNFLILWKTQISPSSYYTYSSCLKSIGRYIRINYQTIFKIFISNAVHSYSKISFLCNTRYGPKQLILVHNRPWSHTTVGDNHCQNSLCGKPIMLKTT